MKKQFIAIVLIFTMLSQLCPVSFADTAELPPVPTVGRIIHEENFSDGTISDHWTFTSDGGSVSENDGAMNMVMGKDKGNLYASYYPNTDKSTLHGLIGVEFYAKRNKPAQTLNIRTYDEDDKEYSSLALRNSKFHAVYSETAQTDGSSNSLKSGSWREFKINILYDTENSAYSVWFDGECVVNNKYSHKSGASSVSYIKFYMSDTKAQSLDLSSFKIYYVNDGSSDGDVGSSDGDTPDSDGSSDSDGNIGSDSGSGSDGSADSGALPQAKPLPTVARIIHNEDFTDGNISSHWVVNPSGGSVVEEGGVMKITRSQNVGTTSARYYLNTDKSVMQGLIGVQYIFKRINPGKTFNIRGYKTDNKAYFTSAIRNNKFHVTYSESSDANGSSHPLKDGIWTEIKVDLLFDTMNSTYSMWFNDECVVDNKYSYDAGTDGLTYINFYIEGTYYAN